MAQTRKYGWRPSLPDGGRTPVLSLEEFPPLAPVFDLAPTGFLPPIWDQGQQGSCTGHGCGRALAFVRAKQNEPPMDPSREFLYYNARRIEGSTDSDAGATIADVIAGAQRWGDVPYAQWPTDDAHLLVEPGPEVYAAASLNQAVKVTRVLGHNRASFEYHFKHCMSVFGVPIVFGFTVYDSFESDAVAKTGVVPMPRPDESVLGGHCVAATAYDDAKRLVKCANSWSAAWGDAGSFYLPYDFIFDPNYASDFRAILAME